VNTHARTRAESQESAAHDCSDDAGASLVELDGFSVINQLLPYMDSIPNIEQESLVELDGFFALSPQLPRLEADGLVAGGIDLRDQYVHVPLHRKRC